MAITSINSMSPAYGAAAPQSGQASAAPAKSSAPQDTVQLSAGAKAAVTADADHDGDSH